jgi:hypothetical protein
MGKLKEDFKAWKKLLMRQTGTGWCPIKGTIVMDDDWWKKAKDISVLLWFCFIIVHCLFLLLTSAHVYCFKTFQVVKKLENKVFKM